MPTSTLPDPRAPAFGLPGSARVHRLRRTLAAASRLAFAACLVIALGTHSANGRQGVFSWLPLLRLPGLQPEHGGVLPSQGPMVVGLLTLLPLVAVAGWAASRLLTPLGQRRPWSWGRPGITLPLLGLTILSLLPPLVARPQGWDPAGFFFALSGTLAAWALYLFVANEEPDLSLPLALVLLLHGTVAVGQFLSQQDLGLASLGELALDPQRSGTSVLMADGQRWLRGYGLTGHPNLLGAVVAVLLLLLLPAWPAARGWRRGLIGLALIVGFGGLVATVSRAAWLAFAAGLALWLATAWWQVRAGSPWREPRLPSRQVAAVRRWLPVALGLAVTIPLLFLYRDMLLSRFLELDSSLEVRSLVQRASDNGVALRLIAAHPMGVGLGSYLHAARQLWPPARVVHNVPLLVTAELGWAGGLFWLALALAPVAWAIFDRGPGRRRSLALLPAWLAALVVGLFHSLPWISTSWRTAVLLGLLAGLWGQRGTAPDRSARGEVDVAPGS